ncbi:MAG TPA: hypothetical protein VE933_11915 [Chitinophagaceae bacterium]|nr:hypothetical protein [Chitinophagaceae bacterium]
MEHNSGLLFRKGEARDIPNIIDTIVAAEKSGTDLFSYSTIFEIPEEEVRRLFVLILSEDVLGQELCYSDYLVAEVSGKFAGAVAAWIEGENGQESSVRKAMLLNYFFPAENMRKAQEKRKYLDQMHFDPIIGSLVIDVGLTLPEFRGQGILARLMQEQTRLQLQRRPDVKVSNIHVMKNNTVAYKIYSKLGYHVLREKTCADPIILKWLPGDTQVVMEKKF